MKNLKDYEVIELNAKEQENTNGGFAWMFLFIGIMIGYAIAERSE